MKSPSDSPESSREATSDKEALAACFRVTGSASGTAFLVGEGFHLLTAKHVVCSGDTPLPDVSVLVGSEKLPCVVLPVPNCDVALLRVGRRVPATPLHLADAWKRDAGSSVRIPGFPAYSELGTWQTADVQGPIEDGVFELGFPNALTDHLGGLSGAPVLDDNNKVIGVFVSHTLAVKYRATFVAVEWFRHLLDFTTLPPDTLRCLVFLSENGAGAAPQLTTAVEAGMKIAAKTLGRPCHVEALAVNTCIADPTAYASTVRELCRADVVAFDLSGYEPAVMLLLGVRSAVRRGVTIGSIAAPLTASELAKAPFNIKELNLLSHSHPKIAGELLESVLARRILYGLQSLKDSFRYRDSVCYDALRYLLPAERAALTASAGALVLCSYDPAYESNWDYVSSGIGSHLKQAYATSSPVVSRALDLNVKSGRLASETIYAEIRRAEFCVVDWTGWSGNVFFELGVRLAVSPLGAQCIIDPEFGDPTPKVQSQLLIDLFLPENYRCGRIGYSPFDIVLEAHCAKTAAAGKIPPESTYAVASASVDTQSEASSIPVYDELFESANLFESNDTSGISSLVYRGNTALLKQSETAVGTRLLAAWEFLNAAPRLLDAHPGASGMFVKLCGLLATRLKEVDPAKARKMLTVVRKAEKGKETWKSVRNSKKKSTN